MSFALVPAVSENLNVAWARLRETRLGQWVDTNVPILSSVLDYHSLSALHSFVIMFLGSIPSLSSRFGILFCSESGLALAKGGRLSGDDKSRIRHHLPLSSRTFCRSLPMNLRSITWSILEQPYWTRLKS
jgi:hypothetical protein